TGIQKRQLLKGSTYYVVDISPDGKLLAVGGANPGDKGGIAQILGLETGAVKKEIPHSDTVWLAQFSPDGSRLVTAAGDRGLSDDGRVKLWDARTGDFVAN